MITVFGKNVGLDDLPTTVERPARARSRWMGIPHRKLADELIQEVTSRGWEVTESRFALSGKDNSECCGALELRIPGVAVSENMSLSLGIITSNAMRRPLKLYAGAVVRVCTNGLATGEIIMKRKHTNGLLLRQELPEVIDEYLWAARKVRAVETKLRETELAPAQAEHALLEAGRQGLMPWSRLGQVDHEYRHPRFEEHGTGTAWALVNAFTWVVKQNPPLQQLAQMNAFRELALAV
jgi:hypothetical protein